MTSLDEKPEYQTVAFFSPTLPAGFNERNPGEAIYHLAGEKFGFSPADFNPKTIGRYHGAGKYGFTFEVEVKWLVAEALAAKNHPSVLNIFA